MMKKPTYKELNVAKRKVREATKKFKRASDDFLRHGAPYMFVEQAYKEWQEADNEYGDLLLARECFL